MNGATRRSLIATIGGTLATGCLDLSQQSNSGTNVEMLEYTEAYAFDSGLHIAIDRAVARTSVPYFRYPDERDRLHATKGAFVFVQVEAESDGPLPPLTAFSLRAGTRTLSPQSAIQGSSLSSIVMATELEPPYPSQEQAGTLAFHLPPIHEEYTPYLRLDYTDTEVRWTLPSRLRETANRNTDA